MTTEANTAAAIPTTAELREMLPKVQVRDLAVEYNAEDGLVLDGVDLDLFPGEVVALLGSSGSGKSTLMRSLTGFAPITNGSVLELLRSIAHDDGIPMLVSLHVLPLALRHSDRIVGLKHGKMLVSAPTSTLDAAQLEVLYDGTEQHDDDEY